MNEDIIELESICERYFGVTPKIARRKAAVGTLPVPAFRLGDVKKGPLFVRRADLDKLVESRISKAVKLHRQMAAAHAV